MASLTRRSRRWRRGEPVTEPLPQAAKTVHQQPRLAGPRQLVRRARVADELDRHVALLQREEPLLCLAHGRAEVLLGLHDQRRRVDAVDEADRGELVVETWV